MMVTGHPSLVIRVLNAKIGQYKRRYTYVKIGITGRPPQIRFKEHLRNFSWEKMVVIYKTTSAGYANLMEELLVDLHWDNITNERKGGGSELTKKGNNYVYLLLA